MRRIAKWHHFIALLCGFLCLPITHLFFNYNYFGKSPDLAFSMLQTLQMVFDSQDIILMFIAIVTYIIKPILMYVFVLILLLWLSDRHDKRLY